MNQYNRLFNFSTSKLFNVWVYKQLVNESRVFTTSATMYDFEAEKIMGELPDGNEYSFKGVYSGLIVTDKPYNFDEARRIAEIRGYDEEVNGLLALKQNEFVFGLN